MQRGGGEFGTCCLVSGRSDRRQEIKFPRVFLGDSWLGTGLCSPGHVPWQLHSWPGGREGGKANSELSPEHPSSSHAPSLPPFPLASPAGRAVQPQRDWADRRSCKGSSLAGAAPPAPAAWDGVNFQPFSRRHPHSVTVPIGSSPRWVSVPSGPWPGAVAAHHRG